MEVLWPPKPDRFEAVSAGEEAVAVADGGHFAEVFALEAGDQGAARVRMQNFDLKFETGVDWNNSLDLLRIS